MARKGTGDVQRAELTQHELQNGIKRFERLIAKLKEFDLSSITERSDQRMTGLQASLTNAIQKTYPPGTAQYINMITASALDYAPVSFGRPLSPRELQEGYGKGISEAIAVLSAAVDDMKEDLEGGISTETKIDPRMAAVPRSVFVVHGHEDASRESVARFLESVDLKPIILHEQAGKGRAIIEKFEDHSNVEFAVVLLTPDDVGCVSKDDVGDVKKLELKPRARQNVVLELGYFVGSLGRERVCALKKGDVEIPSDYLGVQYTELDDAGAWRQALAKELEAAGIQIDWNKVMKGGD